MEQGERGYNSKLQIVDLLYLGVLLYGFSQFYTIKWLPFYILFFVVIYSIALDWRSAVAMARSGSFRYLILDLFTVFNYFGLINTMTKVDGLVSNTLLLFLIHYAIMFFIYIAWNYAILFSNKNRTKRTKEFFSFFNIVGTLAFLLCCFCISHHILRFPFITEIIFLVLIFTIGTIHFIELVLWTYKTYFTKIDRE